jgi:hypothetical protein
LLLLNLRNKDEIDIPEKDWIEDWPNDNDEELERASLEDFDEEWEEAEPPNESLTEAAKQYNESFSEPYQIYVSGSEQQPKNTDWEIIDDDKVHEQNIISEYSKAIDTINNINDSNVDFLNKKRMVDEEIERIKQYERFLKFKKSKKDDDNIITY